MKSFSPLSLRYFMAPLLLITLACGEADVTAESPESSIAEAPADSPASEAPASPDREAKPIQIEVVADELRQLIPVNTLVEVLASGFEWSEGPVWVPGKDTGADGFLLFSDVPKDVMYRWSEERGLESWLRPSGYTGAVPRGGEPGSNGLFLDANGRLILCQHGDRRVALLSQSIDAGPFVGAENAAVFETLADAYAGKRFHSPNDLWLDSAGVIYFTDPPYGLEGGWDDAGRELEHSGVYRRDLDGTVSLLSGDLTRPNGIALSPDERTLYVANSDAESALWMAWTVSEDGVSDGRVLFDATASVSEQRPGLPDGMAVDQTGRLFATGPGGVWVFSADGHHLGTIRLPSPTANVTFGDDGSSLYLTSDGELLRIRLTTRGVGFADA